MQAQDFYMPNKQFGVRFFLPTIVRSVFPLWLPANKSSNSYRISLFDESAAMGDLDPIMVLGGARKPCQRTLKPNRNFGRLISRGALN